jgi:hypothetical protein
LCFGPLRTAQYDYTLEKLASVRQWAVLLFTLPYTALLFTHFSQGGGGGGGRFNRDRDHRDRGRDRGPPPGPGGYGGPPPDDFRGGGGDFRGGYGGKVTFE